jgi:hypothetical protein
MVWRKESAEPVEKCVQNHSPGRSTLPFEGKKKKIDYTLLDNIN